MSMMNLDTLVTFHFKILLLCQNYTLVIIIPPTFNYKCDIGIAQRVTRDVVVRWILKKRLIYKVKVKKEFLPGKPKIK